MLDETGEGKFIFPNNVNLFMESFPNQSETWNWSVARGLAERGYCLNVSAVKEGDWSTIGGRGEFRGKVLYPPNFSYLVHLPKLKRAFELSSAMARLISRDMKCAGRLLFKYPLGKIKGSSALWTHQFLQTHMVGERLSHGLFGLSARRAQMLRAVGIISGPLVGTFGGFDINVVGRREGTEYYAEFFEEADRIIAVSQFIRRKLIVSGAPADRIDVVYYGVDLARFSYREPAVNSETVTFVIVGRLVECKGIEYAIDAFDVVQREAHSARLIIVGDGPLMEKLKQLARKLPSGTYRFLGAVSHDQVRQTLCDGDILLAPGVVASDGAEEALGGSVIEAQAIGLPVICSNVGGLPEAMLNGQSGMLVRPRNHKELASAMLELIGRRTEWPEMTRKGRKHIENNFCSTMYLDKLEAVYGRAWSHYRETEE